jgi:hypothetical protein
MSQADIPNDLPNIPAESIRPWEQRAGPGMGGGGGGDSADEPMTAPLAAGRVYGAEQPATLEAVIDRQTGLATLTRPDLHTSAQGDRAKHAQSNEDLWRQFLAEQLYDTKRVTLEHFHLFEWFPLSPGTYHMRAAAQARREAFAELERGPGGQLYFKPGGKARMVRGGVGAVRLRPQPIGTDPYYFMTASANGICHEGFPVLIPRQFYGPIKERILAYGAASATLSGEMRYIPDEDATRLFDSRRDLPLLYLHVDDVKILDKPRDGIAAFAVSVAASFYGEVDHQPGTYVTFATFDPADATSLEHTCSWIEEFYVATLYSGHIVTDFDAVQPRFPGAVFGLGAVMAGELDPARVQHLLSAAGLDEGRAERVTVVNNFIRVGNISNSTGVAIGPGTQATVNGQGTSR